LYSAVRAPPMCSAPVGDGANLTFTRDVMSRDPFGTAGQDAPRS
jgi:hypothetical protein